MIQPANNGGYWASFVIISCQSPKRHLLFPLFEHLSTSANHSIVSLLDVWNFKSTIISASKFNIVLQSVTSWHRIVSLIATSICTSRSNKVPLNSRTCKIIWILNFYFWSWISIVITNAVWIANPYTSSSFILIAWKILRFGNCIIITLTLPVFSIISSYIAITNWFIYEFTRIWNLYIAQFHVSLSV